MSHSEHAPEHALAAVTHAAPYDYYRRLAAGPPLRFDTRLELWLATGAHGVSAVLAHPDCRVRPVAEAVPAALAGSSCGAIFAELVRMNEGVSHALPRQVLARALAQVDLSGLHMQVTRLASDHVPENATRLNALMFDLPLFAMARLLGFTPAQWSALATWTRDFVACLSPLSNGEQLARAQQAAEALLHSFKELLALGEAVPGSLLADIMDQAQASGWHAARSVLANLVGLLSQTCEATAGLIGNTVIAMRTQQSSSVREVSVHEVSMHDPAIHNTRRYTATEVHLCGVDIAAGQTILVVLASAGCAFGQGRHACPGQDLAQTIAVAVLQAWSAALDDMPLHWGYQPSLNARIPIFSTGGER